jgi:hypothetical protein
VVLEIQVGDVVRCRAPGEALYFEGLVVEDYHDGNYMVDFGADQSTESVNIKDMRKVSPILCKPIFRSACECHNASCGAHAVCAARMWWPQVMSWNELELHDHVQVRGCMQTPHPDIHTSEMHNH